LLALLFVLRVDGVRFGADNLCLDSSVICTKAEAGLLCLR
jgi:hypothetical protein